MKTCAWLLGVMVASTITSVAAQDVKSVDLPAPRELNLAGALAMRPLENQRALYASRTENIRLHHRKVPLKATTKPLSTEAATAPAEVEVTEAATLGTKIKIDRQQSSITESAGINTNYASPVSEPSVAVRGKEVLVTGNWYAAFSTDGGAKFTSIDPYQIFGKFCCDQLAIFDPKTDTFFWLLQGDKDEKGNTFRLMVAKGKDEFGNKQWWILDLPSPALVGEDGWWFDFPDLAVTDKHVFITSNIFPTAGNGWGGGIVIRLDKGALIAHKNSAAKTWRTDVGSLRLTQGAGATMYWVGHNSPSDVLLGTWKDAEAKPRKTVLVDVETWEEPDAASVKPSNGPDGGSWLERLDGRITASWLAKSGIGFAWAVGSDNRFKMPHIRVARVSEASIPAANSPAKKISASRQSQVWSDKMAFAYPSAAPNDKGEIGIAMAYGGPADHPSFAVGVLGDKDKDPPVLASAIKGKAPPSCIASSGSKKDCSVWGDYFTVRRHAAQPSRWSVVGYTIQSEHNKPEFSAPSEYIQFYR